MQLKISTTRTLPYTYRLQHAGFFAYANLSLTLPTEQHMPENKVLRRIPRPGEKKERKEKLRNL